MGEGVGEDPPAPPLPLVCCVVGVGDGVGDGVGVGSGEGIGSGAGVGDGVAVGVSMLTSPLVDMVYGDPRLSSLLL